MFMNIDIAVQHAV